MPNFKTPVAEFLYKLEPDEECGTIDGIGWHGLYLGDLGVEDPEFSNLSPIDQEQLTSNEAVILYEADGQVEAALFDSVEEAEDLWEDIQDDASNEGMEKEGEYAPDDFYQENPYDDIENPGKFSETPEGEEEEKVY